jgi:hypothetical protein
MRALVAAFAIGASAAAAADEGERARTLVARAVAYEHGEGVPREPLQAASLYCEAARMGNADAQYGLGWMFANGRGVARDDELAAGLMRLAAEQGHADAQRAIAFLRSSEPRLPTCLRVAVRLEPGEDRAAYSFFDGTAPDLDYFPIDAVPADRRKVAAIVDRLARELAVSPRLAYAIAHTESRLDPKARSPKNAMGVMQLIPETAQRFNVKNVYDPADNIRGGLAYLRWLLSYYRGEVTLAVAAYNAGEGAVDRYRGIPPYAETRDYVRRVLSVAKREAHPYDPKLADPSPVVRIPVATVR